MSINMKFRMVKTSPYRFETGGKSLNDHSPSGVLISTQAEYDSQGLTPRGERKGAKDAKD